MLKSPTPLAWRTRWALLRLRRAPALAAGPAVRAMGLCFPGPLGLAAGFDRYGALCGHALRLGLGAIELGTLIPGQQRCRARPPAARRRAVCGISIGKRPSTSWAQAEGDFLAGLAAHAAAADYLVLNPGRDCPGPQRFAEVLACLAQRRGRRPLPLVAKLPAAWLAGSAAPEIAASLVGAGAAGLLISAEGADEATATLRRLARALGRQVCLISVGGIRTAAEARARLAAGAHLLQVHRCLSKRGPSPVEAINRAVLQSRSGAPRSR
ncbi:MAG: dihydroorotate dehydrogenase [Bacteroidota bacterium]